MDAKPAPFGQGACAIHLLPGLGPKARHRPTNKCMPPVDFRAGDDLALFTYASVAPHARGPAQVGSQLGWKGGFLLQFACRRENSKKFTIFVR